MNETGGSARLISSMLGAAGALVIAFGIAWAWMWASV